MMRSKDGGICFACGYSEEGRMAKRYEPVPLLVALLILFLKQIFGKTRD